MRGLILKCGKRTYGDRKKKLVMTETEKLPSCFEKRAVALQPGIFLMFCLLYHLNLCAIILSICNCERDYSNQISPVTQAQCAMDGLDSTYI